MAQQTTPFYCGACPGRPFQTRDALLAHARARKHAHCKPCNRFFRSQKSLQQHQTASLAHINPRAKPQPQPVPHIQALQHAQPVQPLPEAVALADYLARRIAALQVAAQLLELQSGQPALHPVPHSSTSYTTIPARGRPAPPLTHMHRPLSTTTTIPQPSQATAAAPPPPFTYRGITYTTLTPTEQTALHPLLLRHCHTPTRLALEGYTLVASPPRTTATPPRHPLRPRRHAVVLDCEMAGTSAGEYPISVSVLDFFSGAVLADALVRPAPGVVVHNWRSKITGITAKRMAVAGRVGSGDGVPLGGREAAAERVLEFVDADTVVVGQSVKFDLKALGLVHSRVVDSAVITAEASGLFRGADGVEEKKISHQAGLEKLCRQLLRVRIRGRGRRSHDSLEDVLATREVVVWCLRHPEELRVRAAKRWQAKMTKTGRQGRKGDGGRNNKGRMQRGNGRTQPDDGYIQAGWWDSDDEPLRWEDVVDYECWPKSPPDWSD